MEEKRDDFFLQYDLLQKDSLEMHNPEDDKKIILKQYRRLSKEINKWKEASVKKLIRKAFNMAVAAHSKMRRENGEPYVVHPVSVALICLQEIGLGIRSTVCALLHDIVEDSSITIKDIQKTFGEEISSIVEGLTKIAYFNEKSTSKQIENFKFILVTIAKDPRVVLIKLADRLHNMRTLQYASKKKQIKIASETNYIYAPLAHRLGLYNIKTELEDLSMKYLEPQQYKEIAHQLRQKKKERNKYINEFISPIKRVLEANHISFEIVGRPKSISSIWNKMITKSIPFSEVYDLFAIRIIIDSTYEEERENCWKVYSLITSLYRPLPDRLRDWVSTPKNNGYEALHITVLGKEGRWVEVQIRTERMNHIAERGLAAHYKYKNVFGRKDTVDKFEQWINEIREFIIDKDQIEMSSYDFISNFKTHFLSEEIYVFTPKGDVIMLPKGSTVIDFAFGIHSTIGSRAIGARVNQRLVSLQQVLKNGDQIFIKTSSKQTPKEEWLEYAFTDKVKAKIKDALKKKKLKEIEDGKREVEKYFEKNHIINSVKNIDFLTEKMQLDSSKTLFTKIYNQEIETSTFGQFRISKGSFVENRPLIRFNKILLSKGKKEIHNPIYALDSKGWDPIVFDLKDNMEEKFYSLASCCKPVFGDPIMGFVTMKEGIKIHRQDCKNTKYLMAVLANKSITVRWNEDQKKHYQSIIHISGIDRMGLVNYITDLISNTFKMNINEISFKSRQGFSFGEVKLTTPNRDLLNKLIDRIASIDGVRKVIRTDEE